MRIKILMLLTSVAVIGSFSGVDGRDAEKRWEEYRRKQMRQQGVFDDTTSGGEHKAVTEKKDVVVIPPPTDTGVFGDTTEGKPGAVTEKKDVVLGPVVGKEKGNTSKGENVSLDDEKILVPEKEGLVKKEDVPVKKELPVMGYLTKDKVQALPKDKEWYIDNFGEKNGETIFASQGNVVARGFDPQYFFIKRLTLGNDTKKFNFDWKIVKQELESLMQMSLQRIEGAVDLKMMGAQQEKSEIVKRMNYQLPQGWKEKETNSKIKDVLSFKKDLDAILKKAVEKLTENQKIPPEQRKLFLKTLGNKDLFEFAVYFIKAADESTVEDMVSLGKFSREQVFTAFEAMALLHSLIQSDEDYSFSWRLPHQILKFLEDWLKQKNM